MGSILCCYLTGAWCRGSFGAGCGHGWCRGSGSLTGFGCSGGLEGAGGKVGPQGQVAAMHEGQVVVTCMWKSVNAGSRKVVLELPRQQHVENRFQRASLLLGKPRGLEEEYRNEARSDPHSPFWGRYPAGSEADACARKSCVIWATHCCSSSLDFTARASREPTV
eukprot:scaffold33913_cov18-Tisochrysis_lutea.AAC.1